eukprot:scaffold184689_cov116-Cyclotella_meneghiniana.AAC.1
MALMSEKWLVMASLVSCMLVKDSGLIGPRVMEVWWMLNLAASSSWVLMMVFLLALSLGTELRTTLRFPNTVTGLL